MGNIFYSRICTLRKSTDADIEKLKKIFIVFQAPTDETEFVSMGAIKKIFGKIYRSTKSKKIKNLILNDFKFEEEDLK